ncbi:MAG: HAD hydrolase family protein, partial [Propionibacteriaceae bacterium]|nr:HAD hydrolase family protein [Propionibacteriaceae bacterium]
GAFYAMTVTGFRKAGHRFFGTTRVVPVSELASLEIDTVEELALADAFAGVLDRPETPAGTAIDVDAVITDFDGVHTADTAYVDEHGRESVRVSRSDGLGISVLRRAGIPFLICSRETNPVVRARAAKLGVPVLQSVADKRTAVLEWLTEAGIDPARTAYVGNDINDLGPMAAVGWPIAVADAHPELLRAARVVLTRRGGHGAVRELCDRVAAAHPDAGAVAGSISRSES